MRPSPYWHGLVGYPSRSARGFHGVGPLAEGGHFSYIGVQRNCIFNGEREGKPVDRPRDNRDAPTIRT